MTYKESLISGLETLLEEPKVFMLGEDIEDPYGGAYTISKGMSTKFPGKLVNTPMSEQGFTGLGVGMALAGYKPIVEIMFGDFSTLISNNTIIIIFQVFTGEKILMELTCASFNVSTNASASKSLPTSLITGAV